MQLASHRAIDAPFAWDGRDLQQGTEWLRPFSGAELAEIDAALHSVKRRGIALFDIGRDDFPLPVLSGTLSQIAQDLETGRGMIMLRGLPLDYSPGDLRTIYWGIGTHLGTYHGRTQYEDYPEAERKRLLLRLWLAVPGSRPLPRGYEAVFGSTEPGAVRGGVPCREGWWRDVTEFRAARTGVHAQNAQHA